MYINKQCPLILSDVYYYDFSACNYNILKSMGWDLSNIEYENKKVRNIQIGYLQKDNPKLASYLLSETERLVDFYIHENNLKEEEVILKQRDGIVVTKKMDNLNKTLPFEFRCSILKLIFTVDRNKYMLITSDGLVEIKGVREKPIDCSFYTLFRNLNYSNNKSLITGIENLRQAILKSKNINWFARIDKEGYCLIPIEGEGTIKLPKTSLSMIDIEEVDKKIIWDNYVWPFAQTLFIYAHK